MSPLSEDKVVSFLIQSDIRQIKSDLQELLTLLKQQEKATAPSSDGDHMAEVDESGRSASPEDVLRFLRETRGEDDMAEQSRTQRGIHKPPETGPAWLLP
jgi:hypothetical protein